MDIIPAGGALPERYAPYVEELQEFFALHNLPVGSPNDLVALSERLEVSDAFPSELSSLARSFIFREQGVLSIPQLLQIVTVAAGGPHLQSSRLNVDKPIRDVGEFLSTVAYAHLDQPESPHIADKAASSIRQIRNPSTSMAKYRALTSRGGTDWIFRACVAALLLVLAYFFIHQFTGSSPLPPDSQQAAVSPIPHTITSGPGTQTLTPTLPSALPLLSPNSSLPSSSTSLSTPVSTQRTSQAQTTVLPSQQLTNPVAQQSASSSPAPPSPIPPTPAKPSAASVAASPATAAPHASSRPTPAPVRPAPSPMAPQVSLGASSGVMSGHLLSAPQPAYPKLASLTHVEGQVMLQAVVAKDGHVSMVRALQGHHLLRGAATNAVRTWRYRPYVSHGRPVDVATIITIDFKLPH